MMLWALANWRFLAGAGIIALLSIILAVHVHAGHKMQEDLKRAKADNLLWAQAYNDEKRAADLQNDAIGKWAIQAADWQQRAQVAVSEAHKANLKAQATAATVLRFKPKGNTVCERSESVADMIRAAQ